MRSIILTLLLTSSILACENCEICLFNDDRQVCDKCSQGYKLQLDGKCKNNNSWILVVSIVVGIALFIPPCLFYVGFIAWEWIQRKYSPRSKSKKTPQNYSQRNQNSLRRPAYEAQPAYSVNTIIEPDQVFQQDLINQEPSDFQQDYNSIQFQGPIITRQTEAFVPIAIEDRS